MTVQSLLNKKFVHSLPTQLLIRKHNEVDILHLENPKDKKLQSIHTNLFLEMELRNIEHFDIDPNFFTPSHDKWPFDLEYFDEIERVREFVRKNPKSPRIKIKPPRTKTTRGGDKAGKGGIKGKDKGSGTGAGGKGSGTGGGGAGTGGGGDPRGNNNGRTALGTGPTAGTGHTVLGPGPTVGDTGTKGGNDTGGGGNRGGNDDSDSDSGGGKRKRKRKGGKKRGRRRRSGGNKSRQDPVTDVETKKTIREKINRAKLIERHSEIIPFVITFDRTHFIMKEKATNAWAIQPESGNIPIANGPKPKKEHWFKRLFPPMGAYQAFMQLTLSAFYRRQTPTWAIQEWDIQLTVTNAAGNDTIEKRNFIQTFIDPN